MMRGHDPATVIEFILIGIAFAIGNGSGLRYVILDGRARRAAATKSPEDSSSPNNQSSAPPS